MLESLIVTVTTLAGSSAAGPSCDPRRVPAVPAVCSQRAGTEGSGGGCGGCGGADSGRWESILETPLIQVRVGFEGLQPLRLETEASLLIPLCAASISSVSQPQIHTVPFVPDPHLVPRLVSTFNTSIP